MHKQNSARRALFASCLAGQEAVELAARLGYWRHLNHAYRERYRQHRDAEEAQTRALWEAQRPDTRSLRDRWRGRPAAPYVRPADSPFTFPPFEPSAAQRANLSRLVDLLAQRHAAGEAGLSLQGAELLRELGRFEEAAEVMAGVYMADDPVTARLMNRLIRERQTAPLRYRL